MKRKTKKKNNLLTVVLVLVGLIAVAGITFACFKFLGFGKMLNKDKEETDTAQQTPVTKEPTATEKPNTSTPQPETKQETEYKDKQPTIQYSGSNPNDAGELSGAITYTGITNDTLAIRVNIDQYVSEGTCSLTVAGSKTYYVEAATVVDSASTATCEGFNVPLSQIKDSVVRVTIEVNADGKKGVIFGDVSL